MTILFVCVHNSGRSQMAQAMLKHFARARKLNIKAESAGTVPGDRINPVAARAMAEIGISMEDQHPTALTQEIADRADRIITMGCRVDADACPARIHVSEDWGLDDPKAEPIEKVREIRDQIGRKVNTLLDELARS